MIITGFEVWSFHCVERKHTADRVRIGVIVCFVIYLPAHLVPRKGLTKIYLESKRKWVSVWKAFGIDYHSGQSYYLASHWGKPLSTESGPVWVLFPSARNFFFHSLILRVIVYTKHCSFLLRNKAVIYLATICGLEMPNSFSCVSILNWAKHNALCCSQLDFYIYVHRNQLQYHI